MLARLARPARAPGARRPTTAITAPMNEASIGRRRSNAVTAGDQPPARPQDAEDLVDGPVEVGDLLQHQARDHAVEGAVGHVAHGLGVAPAEEHGQLRRRALLRGRHALGARVDADDHALGAHDAGGGARGAARAAAQVEHPLAGDHRRPGDRAVVELHAAVAGQHRERVLGRRRVEGVDRAVEADRKRAHQRRARGDLGADLVEHLLGGGRGVARRRRDDGLLPHRIHPRMVLAGGRAAAAG